MMRRTLANSREYFAVVVHIDVAAVTDVNESAVASVFFPVTKPKQQQQSQHCGLVLKWCIALKNISQ